MQKEETTCHVSLLLTIHDCKVHDKNKNLSLTLMKISKSIRKKDFQLDRETHTHSLEPIPCDKKEKSRNSIRETIRLIL